MCVCVCIEGKNVFANNFINAILMILCKRTRLTDFFLSFFCDKKKTFEGEKNTRNRDRESGGRGGGEGNTSPYNNAVHALYAIYRVGKHTLMLCFSRWTTYTNTRK